MKDNTKALAVKNGELAEIELVKEFNRNPLKDKFYDYIKYFEGVLPIYLVRVTSKHYSKLSKKKTNTKSDVYAIKTKDENIKNILVENDYLLDENILAKYNLDYQKLDKSGISVKLATSKSYTILKLTPDSFNSLIGNYEYGACISLFSENENDLKYNPYVIEGWHTTTKKIEEKFNEINYKDNFETTSKDICQQLKTKAQLKTERIVSDNVDIRNKMFKGLGLFDEPYIAWWFYQNNKITETHEIPYSITTGSGRHKGNFTVVFKPK